MACYDLLMLDPGLLTRLTDTLLKYQLDPDHIILSTTCTHSGVEYAEHGIFGNQETGANPGYRDWLVQKTEEAYLAAQPWMEVDGFYAVKRN